MGIVCTTSADCPTGQVCDAWVTGQGGTGNCVGKIRPTNDGRLPSFFDDTMSPSQPYVVDMPSSGVIGGQPVSLGFDGQTGSETEIQTWEEFEDAVPFDGYSYYDPLTPLDEAWAECRKEFKDNYDTQGQIMREKFPNALIKRQSVYNYLNNPSVKEQINQCAENKIGIVRDKSGPIVRGREICKSGYWNPDDAGCRLRPGCERYREPNCVSSHTYRCKNTVICDGEDVNAIPGVVDKIKTAGLTDSPMMKYIVGGVVAIVLWKILEK